MTDHILHEFAVDPGSIQTVTRLREVLNTFGIEHGRLISRFPKKWRKKVFKHCARSPDVSSGSYMDANRIDAYLTMLEKHALVSTSRPLGTSNSWLENAVLAHKLEPFHAIITDEEGGGLQHGILPVSHLLPEDELWDVSREIEVERKPEALARAISPLLKMSDEILFIDPFFDLAESRFKECLIEYLGHALDAGDNKIIEVHCSILTEGLLVQGQVDSFENYCRHHLSSAIPRGTSVECFQWSESLFGRGFHYRHVLTERGGLRVDWGLDRSKDHRQGEFTDIILMDAKFCKKRLNEFKKHRNTPAMCLASVVVDGIGT